MIRVYKYGLLSPTTNAPIVNEQMRSGHRYRNELVQIERGRRAAVRALCSHIVLAKGEGKDIITAKLAARREEIKRQAEEVDRIEGLSNELRKSARSQCGAYWGTYLLVEDAMDASRKTDAKFGKEYWDGIEPNDPSFIRWCGDGGVQVQLQNGLSVPEALSCVDTRARLRIEGSGGNKEQRILRSGKLTQNHGPEELARRAARVRRPERPERRLAVLSMRVCSQGRDPVWADFPMKLHRPLPPEAVIKRISVHRTMIANHEEWTAEFTIDAASETHVAAPCDIVALDLGWRVRKDGIRVAAWHDGADEGQELRLDDHMIGGLRKASELVGVRDDNFNVARKALVEWLGQRDALEVVTTNLEQWQRDALEDRDGRNGPQGQRDALEVVTESENAEQGQRDALEVATVLESENASGGASTEPDGQAWLTEHTRYIAQWRKPSKLASLVWRWRERRFDGDAEIFETLDAWRKQDRHLWQWEAHQREGSLRARKDLYRRWAASFAQKYETLILEQFDLRAFSVRPKKGEEETPQETNARANRQLVAVSILRECFVHAFKSRGRAVWFMPAKDTTRTCSCCGLISAFDAAKSVERSEPCSGCGAQWDQDDNAAINLLGDYRERPGDASDTGSARKAKKPKKVHGKGGRWATAKAEKAARKEVVEEVASAVERNTEGIAAE